MGSVDVALDETPVESKAASARKRKAAFGTGYSTGVSV
jgi:hypothetical protein